MTSSFAMGLDGMRLAVLAVLLLGAGLADSREPPERSRVPARTPFPAPSAGGRFSPQSARFPSSGSRSPGSALSPWSLRPLPTSASPTIPTLPPRSPSESPLIPPLRQKSRPESPLIPPLRQKSPPDSPLIPPLRRPSSTASPLFGTVSPRRRPTFAPFVRTDSPDDNYGRKSTPTSSRQPARCECNCYGKGDNVCAVDPSENKETTFLNKCHVECINCSENKHYRIVRNGACE